MLLCRVHVSFADGMPLSFLFSNLFVPCCLSSLRFFSLFFSLQKRNARLLRPRLVIFSSPPILPVNALAPLLLPLSSTMHSRLPTTSFSHFGA